MKVKKLLAASAAVLTMALLPMHAYADTLAEHDGLKYRISDSGEESLYSGWTKKGNAHYYYKDGVMKKNSWLSSKGKRKYFLQADGKRATGKVTVQGVEYEFDEKGVIVPDAWGLSLTAKDVTPTGCTVVFTQSGGNPTGELGTGRPYVLEQYKNGKWTELEMLPEADGAVWTDEGWEIKNNGSVEHIHEWDWLYGELPAGKYRIGKDISDWREPGDYDKKMYYAYFEIYAEPASLSDKAEAALKEDFAAFQSELRGHSVTSDEAYIMSYYGTYNGCEAVTMWLKDYTTTADLKYITVGGYTFMLSSGSYNIFLHKGNGFIDIKTAYSEGYISSSDIAKMHYYHKNYPTYKMEEWFK